jgi:ABC-2 type transport system ATP-binding protein
MIQIDNLSKYYGDVRAVDNISLEIRKGEIIGLLGPNAAGKTTTLRILTCYLYPSSGTVRVKDFDIHDNALNIKKMIGYLPESAPLYPDMIVYDFLCFLANIRELDGTKKESRIKELANLCGLNEVMHKPIQELSKGYKQRAGLAHAMMNDPEILVLDEPTSGLDPNQIAEIRDIIKEIGREKTVILSTHILSEAEATCNRVVIINKGGIVADGSTDDLKKEAGRDFIMNISLEYHDFEEVKNAFSSLAEVKDVVHIGSDNGVMNFYLSCKSEEKDIRPLIFSIIRQRNWTLLEFHKETRTLENIFRELTKES